MRMDHPSIVVNPAERNHFPRIALLSKPANPHMSDVNREHLNDPKTVGVAAHHTRLLSDPIPIGEYLRGNHEAARLALEGRAADVGAAGDQAFPQSM